MKRITAILLLLCMMLVFVSCKKEAQQSNNSDDTGRSDDANMSISVDEMESMRTVWEGILYAAHEYDEGTADFRVTAIAYTLKHYGYGTITREHKGSTPDEVKAQRAEIEDLCRVTFGDDVIITDDEAKLCFDIEGDTFTVKDDVKFRSGEYNVTGIPMAGNRLICSFKTEEKTVTYKFIFAENMNTDSPYRLIISTFEKP